jgi:hypothetical protein
VTGNLCSGLGQLMDLCGPCILTPILSHPLHFVVISSTA